MAFKRKNLNVAAKTPEQKYEEYKNKDPFPLIPPAFLNDVDIKNYVEEVGIIDPFNEKQLQGVTYEVKLSGKVRYWQYSKFDEGKKGSLEALFDRQPVEKIDVFLRDASYADCDSNPIDGLKVVDQIELQPNSIVFVTLEPFFRLPAYIIARFNLKIKLVYKGLLLGTGPIVDPGFQGRLSIPLHNLTNNTYVLRGGDTIIAMEFTKISPNKLWDANQQNSNEISKIKTFEDDTTKRDVFTYINRAIEGNKSTQIANSIPQMTTLLESGLDVFEKRQLEMDKRIKRNTVGTAIAIATIFISLFVCIFALLIPTWQTYDGIIKERQEYRYMQEELQGEVDKLKEQIDEQEEIINRIQDDKHNQTNHNDEYNQTSRNDETNQTSERN